MKFNHGQGTTRWLFPILLAVSRCAPHSPIAAPIAPSSYKIEVPLKKWCTASLGPERRLWRDLGFARAFSSHFSICNLALSVFELREPLVDTGLDQIHCRA